MVRHDGVAVMVTTRSGTAQRPVLASVDPVPAVGDWVLTTDDAVWATLPRQSLLRRRDPIRDEAQPIVANVDVVVITLGLDRPVKQGRIQRATALAWDAGAEPLVVLTKADLHHDPEAVRRAVLDASGGVPTLVTSTKQGLGIDELREMCVDRTVVMIGESGAGKSSLANALAATEVAAVGEVREGDAKGRHTTTARELHVLPGGGILIDTPGIRSIGLWTDADAVSATFADIEELALDCKFSDCAHDGEPRCAVAAAVEDGRLAASRLLAWKTLQAEVEAAERRAEEQAWRMTEGGGSRALTERRRDG